MKFIAVVGLGFGAIFGTGAVLISILWVFAFFILFHFGSSTVREWAIKRRAEDAAIRAVAGGKKAASGIQVLKDIAAKAESGEK